MATVKPIDKCTHASMIHFSKLTGAVYERVGIPIEDTLVRVNIVMLYVLTVFDQPSGQLLFLTLLRVSASFACANLTIT
jgi:hypothetical protein